MFANVPGVLYEQTINTAYIGVGMNWHEGDLYQNYITNRGDTSIYNLTTGAITANPDSAGMNLSYHTVGIQFSYIF